MKIMVIGAGMQSQAIVFDLYLQSDVSNIIIVDRDIEAAERLAKQWSGKATAVQFDVASSFTYSRQHADLMRGCDAVISAVPYMYNYHLAKAAIIAGCHFCDLGGNNDVTRTIMGLDAEAADAKVSIISDTGLAPGLVSVLAAESIFRVDGLATADIYVGGIPQRYDPTDPFNYIKVFSTEGLVNEYIEPAIRVRNGGIEVTQSLGDLKELDIHPFGKLEASTTSGGASTLPHSYNHRLPELHGRVMELNYRTIRWPGHFQAIKALKSLDMFALDRRAETTELLDRKFSDYDEFDYDIVGGTVVPRDVVIVHIEVGEAGNMRKAKDRKSITQRAIIYPMHGLSAMARATGFSTSIVSLMQARGAYIVPGFTRNEQLPYEEFISELKLRGITVDEW